MPGGPARTRWRITALRRPSPSTRRKPTQTSPPKRVPPRTSGTYAGRPNRRLPLSQVAWASASVDMPRQRATPCATCATWAGSLRAPRTGTGASQGLSVSISSSLQRNGRGHFAQGPRTLEGHDSGEADEAAGVDDGPHQHSGAGEAVPQHAGPVESPQATQRVQRLVTAVPVVHDERQAQLQTQGDLLGEGASLVQGGGEVVEEVQPQFAQGHDARVGGSLAQGLGHRFAPLAGIVRMQTDAGPDIVVAGGDRQRRWRTIRPVSAADDQHAADPRRAGAGQGGIDFMGVAEHALYDVAVRIEETHGQARRGRGGPSSAAKAASKASNARRGLTLAARSRRASRMAASAPAMPPMPRRKAQSVDQRIAVEIVQRHAGPASARCHHQCVSHQASQGIHRPIELGP